MGVAVSAHHPLQYEAMALDRVSRGYQAGGRDDQGHQGNQPGERVSADDLKKKERKQSPTDSQPLTWPSIFKIGLYMVLLHSQSPFLRVAEAASPLDILFLRAVSLQNARLPHICGTAVLVPKDGRMAWAP